MNEWKRNEWMNGLTEDVDETVSDPGVHPAVDDRVEAGVRQREQVDSREQVGGGPVAQDRRFGQPENLFKKIIINL